MAKNGKPYLPNLQPIIAAGINPKTGLPFRIASDIDVGLKDGIYALLNVVDRQDAINRFTWYNLPDGITGQMIENLLYYRGQGMFFYMKENDRFYFLPYALDGEIDVYTRYTGVTPVPLGATKDANGKEMPWIKGLIRKPIYEVMTEVTLDDFDNCCVLLKDYSTPLNTQNVMPRDALNKPLLNIMSNIIPFMNTALSNSTGVLGMRVPDGDCTASVMAANDSVKNAALNGQRYVPIASDIDFQELANGSTLKGADFMQAMESLDNFRLSLYGIENGGLFQKKAHMLQEEQNLANGNVGLVMQDGLTLRQEFCNRINSLFGLGVWVEVSETVTGMDKNMDGEVSDEQDNQEPIDMQVGGGEDAE